MSATPEMKWERDPLTFKGWTVLRTDGTEVRVMGANSESVCQNILAMEQVVEALKEYASDGECYCIPRSEGGNGEPCGHCKARAALAAWEGKT